MVSDEMVPPHGRERRVPADEPDKGPYFFFRMGIPVFVVSCTM